MAYHDIIRVEKELIAMTRVAYATKIDSVLKDKLTTLSKETRVPQSRLMDEAIEDLLKKYGKE